MIWPSVTIVMAVYKPNIEWFEKQLKSINSQRYQGKLDLLIWNDSPRDFMCEEIIRKHITDLPYRVIDNGRNNGVTTAFENLTKSAQGDYIEYADQDDIWMEEKTELMVNALLANQKCLCCHCNFSIIDSTDKVTKPDGYPRDLSIINDINYQRRSMLTKGWLIGCAMLVRADVAKDSLPFPKMIFHDVWIGLNCISKGRFIFIEDVLLLHRFHDVNNSMTLAGVTSKSDYYQRKILKDYNFINSAIKKYEWNYVCGSELKWGNIRKNYADNVCFGNALEMLCVLNIRPLIVLFEIVLPFIPDNMFQKILKQIRVLTRKGIR